MRPFRGHGIALPALIALLVTWSVLHAGLPELRHDWRYSAAGDALLATLAGFSNGWVPQGLGSAQPYPTLYLVGFALWPLAALQRPIVVVAAIVVAAGFIASRAAMEFGARAGATAAGKVALGIFAAANPWVYCEAVAGHIEMLLAYALLLALVAEVTRPKPHGLALPVLTALAVTQIEFLAIAFVPLGIWLARTRRYPALTALLTAAAPIAVGIAASYDTLRSIPYMLPWQAAASVPIGPGSILLGYEFAYGEPFQRFVPSLVILGALAAYGALHALRRRAERVVVAIGIAALFVASGTAGPLAPLYAWCVIHVPESAVFRELYDLEAIVAIAYVVALGRVLAVWPKAGVVALAAAVSLCVPWIAHPVSQWTVPGQSIPLAAVDAAPEARVALFPAFQPLSLAGRGSGFDPDAYVRSHKNVPLNEFYPTFPVDAALSNAERSGDTAALAALGVTQIIVRPYLASQWQTLRYQLIAAASPSHPMNVRSGAVRGRPLLTLSQGFPKAVTIGNDPAESATFFGDLDAMKLVRYDPSRISLDPATGWVDARLAVPSRPEWATAFGGVTTSGDAPLDTRNASAILAQASGSIVDAEGRIVVPARAALHWWRLPVHAAPLRCRGTCVVVVGTTLLPDLLEHAAATPYLAATAQAVFPWFVIAHVPSHARGTLRYAVRYDAHWLALRQGRILPHVRLAMALNGWLVDGAPSETLYLIDWLALVQAVLETICIATLALLVARQLVRRGQPSNA